MAKQVNNRVIIMLVIVGILLLGGQGKKEGLHSDPSISGCENSIANRECAVSECFEVTSQLLRDTNYPDYGGFYLGTFENEFIYLYESDCYIESSKDGTLTLLEGYGIKICWNMDCGIVQRTCSDTDNGKTYTTKGTASDNLGTSKIDVCQNVDYLYEQYCDVNNVVQTEQYLCSGTTPYCNNGVCSAINPITCSDGTQGGQCSTTKPKYCDNGNLVDKCNPCGCPSGQACQPDGTCQTSTIICSSGGGNCKTNQCGTYTDCNVLSATCTSGFCCIGTCTTIPICGNGVCDEGEYAMPGISGYCPQDCCGCDADGICEPEWGEGVANNGLCCSQDCPTLPTYKTCLDLGGNWSTSCDNNIELTVTDPTDKAAHSAEKCCASYECNTDDDCLSFIQTCSSTTKKCKLSSFVIIIGIFMGMMMFMKMLGKEK